MEKRSHRRLAAILAADIVGYSRLVGQNEEATIASLRRVRSDVIEPVIEKYQGRIANTAGDSFLIEFRSAVDALRAAIEIQTSVAQTEQNREEEKRVSLRIGLNVGDVISDNEDILGDGINIAARLEGLAKPGGILASASVVEYARIDVDAEFVPLGPQRLKNIAEPIEAFEVIVGSKRATGKPRFSRSWLVAAAVVLLTATTAFGVWINPWGNNVSRASVDLMAYPLPDVPSIAVLPFSVLAAGENIRLLANGFTEDLITDLSRLSDLFVIAGNTSLAYRGEDIDPGRFAEELGVRYVVDGSLRRTQKALRVNIRLTDMLSGRLLWADRYDGSTDDLFDLQSQFVFGIADALELSVGVSRPL